VYIPRARYVVSFRPDTVVVNALASGAIDRDAVPPRHEAHPRRVSKGRAVILFPKARVRAMDNFSRFAPAWVNRAKNRRARGAGARVGTFEAYGRA